MKIEKPSQLSKGLNRKCILYSIHSVSVGGYSEATSVPHRALSVCPCVRVSVNCIQSWLDSTDFDQLILN